MAKTDKGRDFTIQINDEKSVYNNPNINYDGDRRNSMKFRKISINRPVDKLPDEKTPTKNVTVITNGYKTQKSVDKEYEPYEHRDVKHPTTFFETLIHMLKASLGTGILAMPNAFSNAGYAVATIGTLTIGFLCTYTIHTLINAEYELSKRLRKPYLTYPETAVAAVKEGPQCARKLAGVAPFICNMFLLIYQVGSCCIYAVFIAENIKDIADYYYPSYIMDVKIYLLIIMTPLILINWVPNLKYLAPLSTIANIVTLASFSIIFYFMFTDVPDIDDRSPVANINQMPLFFGTVLFAMEAIGVVMPLENEMKEPRRFGSFFGVLNCAMVPITLMYTFVGFFGYLKYGPAVKGSITLNLPHHNVFAQAARLMLAFSMFVTYALSCYVAFDILWRNYVQSRVKSKTLAQYSIKTTIVLITIALAAAIPDLELFISLIGALCLSTMGLSFPALIQLFTYWFHYKGTQFTLFFLKNLVIIIISLFGFIVGTYTSAMEIKKRFAP